MGGSTWKLNVLLLVAETAYLRNLSHQVLKKKKKKFKIEMGNRSRPLQKFATSVSVAVGGILL